MSGAVRFAALVVALMMFQWALAKDLELSVDRSGAALHDFRAWCPGFGYVADPVVGGEKAVLDCRHAGARLFRTAKCDEVTLEFLKRGQMRALLIVDGDASKISANLKRIADGGFAGQIVGFQLGTRDDAASAAKWRTVLKDIVRLFPKKPVAVPTKDEKAALASALEPEPRVVTHLVVDLPEGKDPAEKLKMLAAVQKRSLIAVLPPVKAVSGEDPLAIAGRKMRTLMSAVAAGRVDAVFFDQKPEADAFGSALRYLGLAFSDYPLLVTHSEDAARLLEGGEDMNGDVEYLVLSDRRWKIVCLVMVNTGKETTRVLVRMEQGESQGCGVRRRVFSDPETGKPIREGLGCYARRGGPFVTDLSAGEIAVVSFGATQLKK